MACSEKTTYSDAGVSIARGKDLVEQIKPCCAQTRRPEVLGDVGGFAGLFRLYPSSYQNPVLLAATDGVGTKLKIASQLNRHDTIGIDLVAMCANDILAQGGEPVLFLDYFACGELSVDVATQVVRGIAHGCQLAGCSLIGGETAELPGLLKTDDYDVAGFCVGLADEKNLCGKHRVQANDVLLGLAANGIHSNGYSLIRHIIKKNNITLDSALGEKLLRPTSIYVKPLLPMIQKGDIQALAHITGGGIPENLTRILNDGLVAKIDPQSWQRPAVFDWVREVGNVAEDELRQTFNDGIGMVVAVRPSDSSRVLAQLNTQGVQTWEIGKVLEHNGPAHVEYV